MEAQMISLSKASGIIAERSKPIGAEYVPIDLAIGRTLAQDVVADMDLPPFDRSQMDGYAVKAADIADAPVKLRILGESSAGSGWHRTLKKGEAVRIMTGAPVPRGADSVQIVELAEEKEEWVTIKRAVKKGSHIISSGKEVKRGSCVLNAGTIINTHNISVPASFGYSKIKVSKQPKVAIISTGSEIVPVAKKPGRDQIRNSNAVMLQALCEAAGAIAVAYPIVRDDLNALRKTIADAHKNADIIVTTGGVSVGKYDLTKVALRELGADIHFERVRLKPGKPTVFATFKKKLVFGLPGNPVSAAVTFHLMVRHALLLMQGHRGEVLKEGAAFMACPVRAAKERDTFLPAVVSYERTGKIRCRSLKWQGSSDFVGSANAQVLICLKAGESRNAGDIVKVLFLP